MLADAHRQAAEDIEATVIPLQADERAARVVIEGAWGAAFHWFAYGCQTKYGKHRESHIRLGTYLRSLGEDEIAKRWEELERIRQGGWYGGRTEPEIIKQAIDELREVATWATS